MQYIDDKDDEKKKTLKHMKNKDMNSPFNILPILTVYRKYFLLRGIQFHH